MKYHENKLRRAIEAHARARIQLLREKATDSVLTQENYLHTCAQIAELKRLLAEIPDICKRILDEEDDDDEP